MNNGYRDIEYKMSEGLARFYLKKRKGGEKFNKMSPQEYLCYVVNEEFGIKGNCVKVLTF